MKTPMKQSISNTFLIILVIFLTTFTAQGEDEPKFHKIRIKDPNFEKVLKEYIWREFWM